MQDPWMERLSEYLDSDLDVTERGALEAHLQEGAEGVAVLEELKRVRARARDLNDAPVPPELWTRIEQSIAQAGSVRAASTRVTRLNPRTDRRLAFSIPELLAACLAVALVSGG